MTILTEDKIKTKILNYCLHKDITKLEYLYVDLTIQVRRLNKWFSKYLDIFSTQMDLDPNRSSPIWQLYHKKYNELEVYKEAINTIQHKIKLFKTPNYIPSVKEDTKLEIDNVKVLRS
jgi:hypothetical protein